MLARSDDAPSLFHSLPAASAIILPVALLDEGPDTQESRIGFNGEKELDIVRGRPEDPSRDTHGCGLWKDKMNRPAGCTKRSKEWKE